ncbi:hypothetical protein [Alkalicoccus halolimnae]|uniref:Uncharacterized protein n=1 Tax=Alkalicoccus halolimnae TaxID=1667239 RepID=A0A5C7F4A5_9BACI|nr:hypothetical protein [Alkalicoccus halolimnae]TXF85491.1 hypothetical protein FTX54_07810 [Alkalicoccus halolimnae]
MHITDKKNFFLNSSGRIKARLVSKNFRKDTEFNESSATSITDTSLLDAFYEEGVSRHKEALELLKKT